MIIKHPLDKSRTVRKLKDMVVMLVKTVSGLFLEKLLTLKILPNVENKILMEGVGTFTIM